MNQTLSTSRKTQVLGLGLRGRAAAAKDLRAAVTGVREQLGFGADEAELPASVEDIDLPARIEPPASLRLRAPLTRTSEPRTPMEARIETWCGRSARRPSLRRRRVPADEHDVVSLLDWCSDAVRSRSPTVVALG